MKIQAYVVSAFTANGEGGNKAGVVLDAKELSDQQMLIIAKNLGFSETAFVTESTVATYRLRFFTPTEEVDLCGHATIATWSLLSQQSSVQVGEYSQETLAGNLGVIINADGSVFMQQTQPQFVSKVDREEIAGVLGINKKQFNNVLTPQVVSTGLKDLLVPVSDKNVIINLRPDFAKMTDLSSRYDVTGLHVFALNKEGQTAAIARNFAPKVGINEESATGTSNGALLCYLKEYDQLRELDIYRIEQGESMGQLSYILGRFIDGRIWIGGYANVLEEKSLDV
jgi:PhzF family phenazine biosynthesis protein